MDIVFRLLLAGTVIVMPSVLFLGLWHGLMRLRDDDLANDLLEEESMGSPLDTSLGRRLLGLRGSVVAPSGSAATCGACGAHNVGHAGYCGQCLEPLPE